MDALTKQSLICILDRIVNPDCGGTCSPGTGCICDDNKTLLQIYKDDAQEWAAEAIAILRGLPYDSAPEPPAIIPAARDPHIEAIWRAVRNFAN